MQRWPPNGQLSTANCRLPSRRVTRSTATSALLCSSPGGVGLLHEPVHIAGRQVHLRVHPHSCGSARMMGWVLDLVAGSPPTFHPLPSALLVLLGCAPACGVPPRPNTRAASSACCGLPERPARTCVLCWIRRSAEFQPLKYIDGLAEAVVRIREAAAREGLQQGCKRAAKGVATAAGKGRQQISCCLSACA